MQCHASVASPIPTLIPTAYALLPSGGGPKRLRTILEGESLLNDASSITLFIVFLEQVKSYEEGHASETGAHVLGKIVKDIVVLAAGMDALPGP